MEYKKLVRDKIPEIIKTNGQTPITHIANDKEYHEKLKQKLLEEHAEFFQKNENIEELADLLEIIYAIAEFKGTSKKKLESIRAQKAKKRGAFKKRIILDETK